jgi:hypothetical protein
MIQDVAITTERIVQEGTSILLQHVHYLKLKKIVTRKLDLLTGIPEDIVQVLHILELDPEDTILTTN